MFRTLPVLILLVAAGSAARAEDIPLETCDRIPVVQVHISGMKYLFLVDTAATSMLNLQSFAHGDSRTVSVTSWTGTVQAQAQEVTVADLAIGQHHFKNLRLPAIDLSAIGRGCGRRIDGIFGIDLLGKLGATVDLNTRTPHLQVDSETEQARIATLHEQLMGCEQAFNRADEAAFADCLDPRVVTFTVAGDFYGREAIMDYYRTQFFRHNPPAQLSITTRAHHAIGEAVWVEYDPHLPVGDHNMNA